MPTNKRSQSADTLTHLNQGELEIIGRMPYSSNGTFLVEISFQDTMIQAIYKPYEGERSLWDFPNGLFRREVAAYALSETLGWELIPETVLRADGPLGIGSLQYFVNADFSEHYFSLFERSALHDQFKRFALFDIIANNADRKSGHLLIDSDSHLWGIDHGLCFHHEPKLRTVIWEFAGERIPEDLLQDLEDKITKCLNVLQPLLDKDELTSFDERVSQILSKKRFPTPDPDFRCYPWPLV